MHFVCACIKFPNFFNVRKEHVLFTAPTFHFKNQVILGEERAFFALEVVFSSQVREGSHICL